MIVTLTANPSLDRLVSLAGPLERGAVLRSAAAVDQPGGKGVNVARVVTAGGRTAVAVLPGHPDDPLLLALREAHLVHTAVPIAGYARVNLTLAEPDGTTTKVNAPGAPLDEAARTGLVEALRREADGARWVALSGSLPPGVADDWYGRLAAQLRGTGARVAVDTSGAALLATAGQDAPASSSSSTALPDLLKPNAEELAELTGLAAPGRGGAAGAELEADPVAAAKAASTLVERGVETVLVTLGGAGALLVTADGAWHAVHEPVTPVSTVGAGDSTLAGYLLAELDGADEAERLAVAVAHGTAAVQLPGSTLPGPEHVQRDRVTTRRL
ncbi:1-phosphofructokinase [Quadrisphaera granulorum]|uniref:1-phosphofructokinase n=1 Tax=Quadrisphaera granulorum TaxID=317664 RepID=A0A315ZX50_9ACTN|nr:1-phosphofructokinase family hexose kinase [Quadrisphaera granulorum]PWJ50216.1 1-phosphofructokinase [Quadrisphaera granulorum]SZE97982.1 1-phosphofructokinase [Quadrisphaera granulorum]